MLFAERLAARFHAIYENWELVVAIRPLRIIQGEAPLWVCNKVLQWAEEHQGELLAAWSRCQRREGPLPIAPLA